MTEFDRSIKTSRDRADVAIDRACSSPDREPVAPGLEIISCRLLELQIREVSTGIFAFDARELLVALEQVSTQNAQGEHYLPDNMPRVTFYEPTERGLEARIRERLAALHERDRNAQRPSLACMHATISDCESISCAASAQLRAAPRGQTKSPQMHWISSELLGWRKPQSG